MFVDDNITTGVEGRSTKVQAVWHTGVEAGGEKNGQTRAKTRPQGHAPRMRTCSTSRQGSGTTTTAKVYDG
jgi:hypothetical protein